MIPDSPWHLMALPAAVVAWPESVLVWTGERLAGGTPKGLFQVVHNHEQHPRVIGSEGLAGNQE